MIGDPTLPTTWRPQAFGRRPAREIEDPLVEPLWSGIRVLAHTVRTGAQFLDAEGGVQDWPDVAAALGAALAADDAVLDGYLTTEAASDGTGILTASGVSAMRASDMARQFLVGGGVNRRGGHADGAEDATPRVFGVGDVVVFVAVDLVRLDGEPLLDVPLLERKRLLDGVLMEGLLVRRGIHVRPPIDVWVSTWRSLGFRSVAYKQANSRYRPGERNDDWSTASIPRA
jgi:ATP-dependent DNA ligase